MRLNKDDIYSLIGTVAFHGVILLILWFTVLKTEVPDEDGGVLVNFGNVDAAAGMFEPKYTGQEPPQETTTPPPPVPEPQVETPKQELITQDIEESVALEDAKKKKEEEKRKKQEAEKKRKEEEEKERILQEDGEKYALSCAMKLLSYRMRTAKELRDKLREKEIAEETVGRVIRKLEEIGYLDDGRFAELYAQELSRKYGRYVVIQKLMQKGIPRDIAQAAAQSTEKDEDVIRGHIGRLKQKYRAENEKSAKQKIMRALMAKGFEYEEIKRALERHEEE